MISERGRHHELLKQKGLYADLWERQKAADEARETLKRVEAPLHG